MMVRRQVDLKSVKQRCMNFFSVMTMITAITGALTGCSVSSMGDTGEGSEITIVDFTERSVSFDHIPERIVALGHGEADIIYALGGDVVGRPSGEVVGQHAAMRDVQEVGSVHTVVLERIAVLQPDVVLGNDPINTTDIEKLASIGAKVVLTHAHSIEDIRRQVELFGQLLAKEDQASALLEKINTKLSDTEKGRSTEAKVLMVYGAPGTYLAALPNSLAGDLLVEAGGTNVAAAFEQLQSFPQYAQLNTERVVEANPDMILIMTHGSPEDVEEGFIREMAKSPAWSSIEAVQHERVHVLPSDLFGTNPGTRVVEAVRYLEELLAL